MDNVMTQKGIEDVDQSVLRAVYALNMCTVSVSQIINYNDVYILEQEYDAILNNLNLEKMPKADALKNILIELLNTITFFRIQEIRKTEIEKKYQQRMKNAIWSAIPNLNVIVAGGPAAIAYSLASQVGIGYMNYRKEKNNVLNEKEKEALELRITAIEQFNALKRELFTTAWELAEEYNFDDRLRLTEKQIKQYNEILMDQDELRKYVRLEAIQNKFKAYPPFWYFFGHTACYIADNEDLQLEAWERNEYRRKAKVHFQKYANLNKFNILREDQMTSAFALEYIDLLLLEENPDNKPKIDELIHIAVDMSGNSLDVKELCAIAYLKIGNTDAAAELLKQLVNEEYNTITNAKLLSRIYVSQYLNGSSKTSKFDYKTLQLRVGENNSEYLFPMPERIEEDSKLQVEYLVEQKVMLQMDYRSAINELSRKFTIKFNAVMPAPYGYSSYDDYYSYSEQAIMRREADFKRVLMDSTKSKEFIDELASAGFRFKYIDILNEVMDACDDFELWKKSENHDVYTISVRANIVQKRPILKRIQESMLNSFTIEDYITLQREVSFKELMGTLLSDLKETIMNSIDNMTSMESVEKAEYNLAQFCQKYDISLSGSRSSDEIRTKEVKAYLSYEIFGLDGVKESERKHRITEMKSLVKVAASELMQGIKSDVNILIPGNNEFDLYFENTKLNAGGLKEKILGIIDDKTKKDCDLVLTNEGLLLIYRNKINLLHSYENVGYTSTGKRGEVLLIGWPDEYSNKNINIGRLYNLIKDLGKICEKK